MKKVFLLSVVLLLSLCAYLQAEDNPGTVAVVEFDVKGNVSIKDAGTIIAEWMSSAAAKTGKFELYERILLKKVLEEQKLGVSGLINEETASRMGELYGVDALITGSVIEWQGIHSVSARLLDTETGQILATADYKTRDTASMASVMDRMAAVLAGTMSQEALDRESLSITQDKRIKTPFSIIKVFERDGRLKAAINKGINDNVEKNSAFAIYMPKYQVSEVSGRRTIVGKERVGELLITQVEPSISSGNLYVGADLRRDPGSLEREGIAIRRNFTAGVGVGGTNLGGHIALHYLFPKQLIYTELSFTAPTPWYDKGLFMNGGVLFNLVGSYASTFSIRAGGSYLGFFYELKDDVMADSALILGVAPQAEVTLFRWLYLRGGVLVGFDSMADDFAFAYVPMLQAGVSIYF